MKYFNKNLDSYFFQLISSEFSRVTYTKELLNALSNDVWHIKTQDHGDLILKIFKKDKKHIFTRHQEIKIYDHNLDFVPKLLSYKLSKYFIFQYIQSAVFLNPDIDLEDSILLQLVDNLSKVHKMDLSINKRNFVKYSKNHLAASSISRDKSYDNISRISNYVYSLIGKFKDDIVLSHNDMNPNNLLVDANKKLWFIDFEYCSYNDVYIDIVSISSCLTSNDYKKFLEYYSQKNSFVINYDKLEAYRLLLNYVSMIWYYDFGYHDLSYTMYLSLCESI